MKHTCLACGCEFTRGKKAPDYPHKYCSRPCFFRMKARQVDEKKLVRLREWGLSLDAIGARLGCSQSVVSRALRRMQLA